MSGDEDTTEQRPTEREYHHVLNCPCGTQLTGDTEDEIVDVAFAHLRAEHPAMAEDYEREHVLFMTLRLPKPTAPG